MHSDTHKIISNDITIIGKASLRSTCLKVVKVNVNLFGSATTNPIRALGRLRQIKMCFIWYGKPVKCMQTTLLLSAADQSLNKLGGVKEL